MKHQLFSRNSFLLFALLFLLFETGKAQMSGNQVYRNRNSYENSRPNVPEIKHFYATDSTLVINVNVLMNKKADLFKITLGLNEEAETPKKAAENMNIRIENFSRKLSSLGIKKEDFYIDFISQTKVYDVSLSDDKKLISEKIKGFEIKKNIIIKTDDHSKIEKIIYEASEYQIYDIIKIDYLNTSPEKIHQNLLDEANRICNDKKEDYFKKFKKEIIGTPTMNSSFSYIFPSSQYQQYTAYESSDFDLMRGYYNNDLMIRKMERKGKTFYYEGASYNGFDKIINNEDPEIGIQYIINMSIKYDFKKNR